MTARSRVGSARRALAVAGATLMLAALAACRRSEPAAVDGPEERSDLVVLFSEGTAEATVADFESGVLAVHHPGGNSRLLPGIRHVVRVRVGGCDGYALQLDPNATPEQLAAVHERAAGAEGIEQVVTDAVPSELRLCPAE